ncbi:RHS repeat-associated core domain-containing protein [Pseudomonas sp. WJP1]|uniref:RHS repeat-associated core domain-containing protein n=1 Tax=Pseudomonas sp. WJP1 TaxID=2986947 RepID=UPI002349C789|nr:RHS repeat-associated core domain-containing protein [Pseudomonas sp. WJP1]WCM49784.1 RHS repeat-associated core domain-containing protein [Pseudomonas sp. WJP1]
MPISPRPNLLCSYRYDALDRSIDWAPIGQASIQRFHCKERLATEIQDSVKHSIFQHEDQVLGQQQHMDDKIDITLLTTDLQGSVLNALDTHRPNPIAYTPYGHRRPGSGLLSLLGFNGERPDPVTGHYHLGHGYRQFNPVLMRFNSPDSLSPFGKGGLNSYVYCGGNPVNRVDPSGHKHKLLKGLKTKFRKSTNDSMSPTTEDLINTHAQNLSNKNNKSNRMSMRERMTSETYYYGDDMLIRIKQKQELKSTTKKQKYEWESALELARSQLEEMLDTLKDMTHLYKNDAAILKTQKQWQNFHSEVLKTQSHFSSIPMHRFERPSSGATTREAATNIRNSTKEKMD